MEPIKLINMLGKSVRIRRKRDREWVVKQWHSGDIRHDFAQAATWIRIENPGRNQPICIEMQWAEYTWMQYKNRAYQKIGNLYRVLSGEIFPEKTRFQFDAPKGISYFGVFPWYSNEDGDRLFEDIRRRNFPGSVRSIGRSQEGREIKCLAVGGGGRRKRKENVLILGREHATETSSSFAVAAIAEFLTGKDAPSDLLQNFIFHLIPIANPDGVANGTKLPQDGPTEACDPHYAGMTASDSTCKALRDEVLRLKPVCFSTYHAHLFPVPAVIFYDKRHGMAMLDYLIGTETRGADAWYAKRQRGGDKTMINFAYQTYGTVAVLWELPWAGHLPAEIQNMGVRTFLSMMEAYKR